MKVNKIKILGIIFLIVSILSIIIINPKALESEGIEKGELRCPSDQLGKTCFTELDSNGKVKAVKIIKNQTYSDGDKIKIEKIVSKTNNVGKLNVKFNVSGNVEQIKTHGDSWVVVILDTSKTIENNLDKAKKAVKSFASSLIPDGETSSNYHLALIQFATYSKTNRRFATNNFQNTTFYGYNTNGLKTESQLEFGLQSANTLFNNSEIGSNDSKYIVLIGDGQYWYDDDTNWNLTKGKNRDGGINYAKVTNVVTEFNKLKNNNVKFWGIRYSARAEGGYSKKKNCNNKLGESYCNEKIAKYSCTEKNEEYSYGCFNKIFMEYITSGNWQASSFDNLANALNEVSQGIQSEEEGSVLSYNTTLVDNLGEKFSLTDGSANRYKKFNVEQITENVKSYGPFEIEIDDFIKDGWYETNLGFNLSYTSKTGEERVINSNVNPEIYWIGKESKIDSCSDIAIVDSNINLGYARTKYYEVICDEGYTENNTYYRGMMADIKINNLERGRTNFSIQRGFGFPATINLSTHVKCQYNFNIDLFRKDYNELVNNINKASDKEKASLEKQKIALEGLLGEYYSKSMNDLNTYQDRFYNQDATLEVKYNNGDVDNLAFITTSKDGNIQCTKGNIRNILGYNIIQSELCYANFSKTMILPMSCLDASFGTSSECTESNNLIAGGNNYYTNPDAKNGEVYVNILDSGYSENIDFGINARKCTFDMYDKGTNIKYRSIELNDPFLINNYDKTRKTGSNYLNDTFDFRNIIKPEIWNNDPLYKLSLSKFNIENIKKDTSELGVNSYLGKSCHFNTENKYVCDFLSDGRTCQDCFTQIITKNS